MRRSPFPSLILAMSFFAVTSLSVEASSSGSVGRIPTVTRLVHVFLELEGELNEALGKRDMQAVSKLLTDDFEMRVANMPGNPVPRAAWIRQSFKAPEASSLLEQMAVHDFGAIAIVSYLWSFTPAKSEVTREIFVVDTWRQDAGHWKLAVRYAAPGGLNDATIPGVASDAPAFEKKE